MAYTHLEVGKKLEVSETIYFRSGSTDISPFVCKSLEELQRLEKESAAQEEAIYSRILDVVQEWIAQASRTVCLQKAQEYLKTRPALHTANQWSVDEYGCHEMSNMVYRFWWREYERTKWDRATKKSVPVAWELSWSVHFNTIPNPDYCGSGRRLAGQERKVFKDRVTMEKYLQGRIAAYAHLFTEICPPIPEDAYRRFCVNGILLPGYTVEHQQPVQPDPDTVDDLLSYLDDDDMSTLFQPEEQEPPAEQPSPKPSPPRSPSHKHRRPALTR